MYEEEEAKKEDRDNKRTTKDMATQPIDQRRLRLARCTFLPKKKAPKMHKMPEISMKCLKLELAQKKFAPNGW